jgi:hypothetical protein
MIVFIVWFVMAVSSHFIGAAAPHGEMHNNPMFNGPGGQDFRSPDPHPTH